MRIVSQSQDISIPLDRAVLRRDGMTINAELENGKNYLLGAYESEKDAQEEFNRVSALIGAGHLNIIPCRSVKCLYGLRGLAEFQTVEIKHRDQRCRDSRYRVEILFS